MNKQILLNAIEHLTSVLPEFNGTTINDLSHPTPKFVRDVLWSTIEYKIKTTPGVNIPIENYLSNDFMIVNLMNDIYQQAGIKVTLSIFNILTPNKSTTVALIYTINLLTHFMNEAAKRIAAIETCCKDKESLVNINNDLENLSLEYRNIVVNNEKLCNSIKEIDMKCIEEFKTTQGISNDDTDENILLKIKENIEKDKTILDQLEIDLFKKKNLMVDDYESLKEECEVMKKMHEEFEAGLISSNALNNLNEAQISHFEKVLQLQHENELFYKTRFHVSLIKFEDTCKEIEEKQNIMETVKQDILEQIETILPIASDITRLNNEIITGKEQPEFEICSLENNIQELKKGIEEQVQINDQSLQIQSATRINVTGMVKRIKIIEATILTMKEDALKEHDLLLNKIKTASKKLKQKITDFKITYSTEI